jgi:GNAT superfamily N-acetyltransferase
MSVVTSDDTLRALVEDAAHGRFPTPDGTVRTLPRPAGPVSAVLSFAAHSVVAADVDPAWVARRVPAGDLGAPLSAAFLHALEVATGGRAGSLDVVLAAFGRSGLPPLPLAVAADVEHQRVRRAERYRSDLRTWTAPGGLVLVGRGLVGRWEASFEVEPEARSRGLGRALADAAKHLVPAGEPLFLQVAPGNVPSLRAVLAAGYTPIGAEVLFLH